LADGEHFHADVVASNVSAKVTFTKLVDRRQLPAEFLRDIDNYRTFSTGFKINIACERLPEYSAFDAGECGFAYPSYTHIGPTFEYLERAYDDAKYGDISRRPFISPVAPTTVDHTITPPGKHVFGGHAPYELKDGDWSTRKGDLVERALGVLEEFAPGFSDGIIDASSSASGHRSDHWLAARTYFPR
jgi:phytoene dehydrogenase-like protein